MHFTITRHAITNSQVMQFSTPKLYNSQLPNHTITPKSCNSQQATPCNVANRCLMHGHCKVLFPASGYIVNRHSTHNGTTRHSGPRTPVYLGKIIYSDTVSFNLGSSVHCVHIFRYLCVYVCVF